MIIEFNPTCKHDRTSYSIVHCDACREFSRRLEQARAAATPERLDSGAHLNHVPPTKT